MADEREPEVKVSEAELEDLRRLAAIGESYAQLDNVDSKTRSRIIRKRLNDELPLFSRTTKLVLLWVGVVVLILVIMATLGALLPSS